MPSRCAVRFHVMFLLAAVPACDEGGDGPAPPGACEAQVFAGTSQPNGYERCDDGGTYRASPVACPGGPDDPVACTQPIPSTACGDDGSASCMGAFPGSTCVYVGVDACACLRPCTSDADCGAGGVCVCRRNNAAGSCVAVGDCRTSDDCPADQRCGLAGLVDPDFQRMGEPVLDTSPGASGFYCTTQADECRVADDCEGKLAPPDNSGVVCAYDVQAGRRRCAHAPALD